jgi:hypothetical protein
MRGILLLLILFGSFAFLPQRAGAFVGYTGKSQGVGGAGVAESMDATSFLLNPAGIVMRQTYALSGMGGILQQKRWIGAAVIDTQTSPLGLGVGYTYSRKTTEEREHFLRVALAEYYLETIFFGISYRHHWFWDPSFNEYRDFPAFGLGMILPLSYFRLGFSLIDFFPRRDPYLDPRVRGGISIPLPVSSFFELGFYLDGICKGCKNQWEIAGGAEFLLFKKVFLRGGYHQDLQESRGSYHLGAGLDLSIFRLDYAMGLYPGGMREHGVSVELSVF